MSQFENNNQPIFYENDCDKLIEYAKSLYPIYECDSIEYQNNKLFQYSSKYPESKRINEGSFRYNYVISLVTEVSNLVFDNIETIDSFCCIIEALKREADNTLNFQKSNNIIKRCLNELFGDTTGIEEELNLDFIIMFFERIQYDILKFSITYNTFKLPNDYSISAVLEYLPNTILFMLNYIQNTLILQFTPILLHLSFLIDKGGIGSLCRIIIDMIESQLFSIQAIIEKRISLIRTKINNENIELWQFLYDMIMPVLGPLPNNLAYGPIIKNIILLQAINNEYKCIELLLKQCNEYLLDFTGNFFIYFL